MVENTSVMESETYRFIGLIEKHPQLYNKKHKDFLRQDIRNSIWESICKEMGWDDLNKAKKKWRNLRDKFVKKRRRHNNGSNLNEDEGQREFYNSLMFLDGHVNSRNVRTSTTPNTSTVISTTNSTNQTAQQQQQQQQQPQQQYVHVTTNQIPIEHINLEYLSNVNVSEDAQCLLDISNNTNAINSHHHAPQPTPTAQQTQQIATSAQHNASQQSGQTQTHQSLAAQHIQQFKIEYPSEETNYADDGEEVIVSQCAVAVEAAPTSIENSSIANYDGHTHTLTQAATSTTLAVAPAQLRNIGTTATKKIYHQVINSNGLITSTPHQLMTTSIKRQRLETHAAAQNSEQPEYNEAITAAVDYFKQQTATGDADAAFAKYILEELRGMNKKRKNDFKRMVATWLTTEDDEAGLE